MLFYVWLGKGYFFFSFFNLYDEQSVPGVSNYSAIHWQVERYWFCISCVHFPSSSLPFNVHDDFIGRESFFPRLGHFIQALFSFLLLSSSKGLVPLKGGKTPKAHLADPSYMFSWHQQFKQQGGKNLASKLFYKIAEPWSILAGSWDKKCKNQYGKVKLSSTGLGWKQRERAVDLY